jgi:hypothetical protein
MSADESFGRRLRRERERRQIPLSSISANTKISVALLEAVERDDVARWPAGIFRRAYIRAYAENIGLDAEEIVREFLQRFPDPTNTAQLALQPSAPASTLRLTLVDDGPPIVTGVFRNWRVRLAAVACDAAVLAALTGAAYLASGVFWLPLAIAMLCYYVGGVVLLGNTPGMYACERAERRTRAQSQWGGIRGVVQAADALLHRVNRAVPESSAPLGTEPGTSES